MMCIVHSKDFQEVFLFPVFLPSYIHSWSVAIFWNMNSSVCAAQGSKEKKVDFSFSEQL